MVIRLVGAARLVDGQVDVRVGPALVDRQHPLAAVEGAFNAVMLQGDAIREITLEGPGAGGIETASAVIADMASVIGTMGTGFLQNDAVWRSLPRLAPGEHRSPFYFHLSVDDRPGRARPRRRALAERDVSIARLHQHPNGDGAALHVVTHETRAGRARRGARGDRGAARRCGAPLPFPSSPTAASRSSDGRDRALPRPPAGRAGDAVVTLGEGGDAARPRPPLWRADRRRAVLQVRGNEPDRQLQGPRHGGRRREGGRERRDRRSSAPRPATPPRRPPPTPRAPASRRRPPPGRRDRAPRSSPSRARSVRRCSRCAAASTRRCAAASSSPRRARSRSSTR